MLRRAIPRALVVALLAVLAWLPTAAATSSPLLPSADEPPPVCTAPPGSWSIGTHNVLHGTAAFTPFASIIGWQEVDKPGSWTRLQRQLGAAYSSYIPLNRSAAAVPVSWRRDKFQFLSAWSVKTHEGLLGVTPDRWISVVHLRARSTGRAFYVLNTHFISEAFKTGSSYQAWRLARWYEHLAKLRRLLSALRYSHPGAAIFLVGDFNHHGYLDFSPQRVYPLLHGTSTPIDQLYAGLPGRGDCVEKLSMMGSDHNRWLAAAWIG